MLKYVKNVDIATGICGEVGLGDDAEYYEKKGFVQEEVDKGYDGLWYIAGMAPDKPEPTVQDYDDALEAHLLAERTARGYTTREPDYYINSSVERWKQDAQDWIAHRDAVMIYGLEIENDCAAGKPVPSLEEFKAELPKIKWTIKLTE